MVPASAKEHAFFILFLGPLDSAMKVDQSNQPSASVHHKTDIVPLPRSSVQNRLLKLELELQENKHTYVQARIDKEKPGVVLTNTYSTYYL